MKKAFTVVELLIASVIAIIILTGVATAYASGVRLLRIAMAEAEFSLAARQLRDRLLFRIETPDGEECKGGLLSATSQGAVLEGGAAGNVIMDCPSVGSSVSDLSYHSLRLILENGMLVDERSSNRNGSRSWLSPGSFRLTSQSMSDIAEVDFPGANARCLTLDLKLRSTGSKVEMTHAQKILIPVFGRVQQ